MLLEFGTGKIGVTTVVHAGTENVLLIEHGNGTGKIGECPEGREKDRELDLNDLGADDNKIVMEFTNVPSVQVVIDALELIKVALANKKDESVSDDDEIYPCADCGIMRSKNQGGTTFTVCDECWDKHYKK